VRVGLVQAATDPALLGLSLRGRQRDLLAAAERHRLNVWATGRRGGKTLLSATTALWDACLRPELAAYVRPGERRYAVCVAVNVRQARIFLRAARTLVDRSPLLSEMLLTATEDELIFENDAVVAAFPCTAPGGRGWPISCLVLDEFAHHTTDGEGPAAAERVWSSMTPSVAQFGDLGRVIVASTPWGSEGMFACVFQMAQSGELPDAVAFQVPTVEMNPRIDHAFLERERLRDPTGFESEYGARFVGGGASFFDPDQLADAVADRGPLLPEQAPRLGLRVRPRLFVRPGGCRPGRARPGRL
jgi:hypothetical protein